MRLHIRKMTAADFGSYKCLSKNSLGETDGSIKVYSKKNVHFFFFIFNVQMWWKAIPTTLLRKVSCKCVIIFRIIARTYDLYYLKYSNSLSLSFSLYYFISTMKQISEVPQQTVNAIDAKDKHLRGTYHQCRCLVFTFPSSVVEIIFIFKIMISNFIVSGTSNLAEAILEPKLVCLLFIFNVPLQQNLSMYRIHSFIHSKK